MTATVALATADFGLAELDLLATHAGVRFPFPLRVPSVGKLAGEREALFADAGQELRDRGLATEHGPVGLAGDLVTALRKHRGAVDLVVLGAGAATGVVAMVYGNRGLICHQSLSDPGTVQVAKVTAAALADELSASVPNIPPATFLPITVPPDVVGINGAVLDQLVDVLPALTGRGQLGVVRRSGGISVSRPLEMSWLDSPRGRVRVDRDSNGWLSVNPLRRSDLIRVLREAVELARG